LFKDGGCVGHHVWLLTKTIEKRGPTFDAVIGYAEKADVRTGSDKALLKVLAKSIVNGECDNERSDPGSDADNRNAGNDADESLAALGTQVPGRNEKFEAHEPSSYLSAVSFQLESDYTGRARKDGSVASRPHAGIKRNLSS
jgi:hypothetical protein